MCLVFNRATVIEPISSFVCTFCCMSHFYASPGVWSPLLVIHCRRTTSWVCKLLPLRIPRMYEEPGALLDHRGPSWNERHQVRTHPRLPTVQIPRGYRACVRLSGLPARTWLPRPAALIPGAPKPQSYRRRLPAESTRTLSLAQLGAQPGHLVPNCAIFRAHTAARRIFITGARTRSPLFQLHRSRKHAQFTQCAARNVNNFCLSCFYLYDCKW